MTFTVTVQQNKQASRQTNRNIIQIKEFFRMPKSLVQTKNKAIDATIFLHLLHS